MTAPSIDQLRGVVGRSLHGPDGSAIGRVGQVFVDDDTEQPEWVTVRTGLFGSRESFVPLAQARVTEVGLAVPYDKDRVKGAPTIDLDEGNLSEQQEAELYRYYGLERAAVASELEGRSGGAGEPAAGETVGEGVTGGPPRRDATGLGPGHPTSTAGSSVRAGGGASASGRADSGRSASERTEFERTEPGRQQGETDPAGFGGSEVTIGTGPGGTMTGTPGLSSPVGINSNLDPSERGDLLATTGSEEAYNKGHELAGPSLTDAMGTGGDTPPPGTDPATARRPRLRRYDVDSGT